MIKQIKLLAGLSLCNLLGMNEFRFTRDTKKKTRYRLMEVLWCLLAVMMMGYVGAMSYGLIYMRMAYYVPAVLALCVAILVFVFTMLKAGTVLFDKGIYEKQIALPVTVRAIIISRFLSMYFSDMLLGILVMLPGMAVYGVMERPGLSFYLYGLLGSIFLPLLPLTLASVVGAVITGISSRWRKKNLVAIVLTMLFVCLLLVGSFGMSEVDVGRLEEMVQQLAPLIEEQIRNTYPPALWLSEAMANGKIGMLLLFIAVSIGGFLVFLEALRPFYGKICSLLNAHAVRGNYRMKGLNTRSVMQCMVDRELRHYFSSVIYVTNTLVGNVLTVILAGAVLAVGKETVEEMIGMPGIVDRGLPVLLGMLPAMMPLTACSISMEGKQWWMMQTFPVSRREVLKSKVWAGILVAAPFYLVSEMLAIIALKPVGLELLGILAVPAAYIYFGAKAGVFINCRFPSFDWENEARIVKQSASALVMMLAGIVSGMVPMALLICFPGIPAYMVYAGVVGILAALTGAFSWRAADRTKQSGQQIP